MTKVCEVCNKGQVSYPGPVILKGKSVWACSGCFCKEYPGCLPHFPDRKTYKGAYKEGQWPKGVVPMFRPKEGILPSAPLTFSQFVEAMKKLNVPPTEKLYDEYLKAKDFFDNRRVLASEVMTYLQSDGAHVKELLPGAMIVMGIAGIEEPDSVILLLSYMWGYWRGKEEAGGYCDRIPIVGTVQA